MKVWKFGGTSVGSAERIKHVAQLVTSDKDKKIVVLSAMSGTTNVLVEISEYLYKKNPDAANELINTLEKQYYSVVEELFNSKEFKEKGRELVKTHFDFIKSFTIDVFTQHEEKSILAQGELISTALFNYFLNEGKVKSVLLSSLDFMRIDKNMEPDSLYIKENIKPVLEKNSAYNTLVAQGYICRNAYGEVDNLQRGGSDYTASLIGAATDAEEVQIWTDIDGMHNNDPRFVEGTKPVRQISFDEAAELAYFGAKILHPTSVLPAKLANIPVRLLNTLNPKAEGTLIGEHTEKGKIKAIAAKDNITFIKIKSGRMLLAYGFLRKIFEIFESFSTPIDMVTTSEVGVSVTIDNDRRLEDILDALKKFGSVEYKKNQSIVCIVGDLEPENLGFTAQVIQALKNIPLKMISYGGSRYNISVLINTDDKKKVLNQLSKELFQE